MAENATPAAMDKPLKAVVGGIVTLLAGAVAKKFGYEIPVETVTAVVVLILTYVISYKTKGAIVERESIRAQAQALPEVQAMQAKIEAVRAEPSESKRLGMLLEMIKEGK